MSLRYTVTDHFIGVGEAATQTEIRDERGLYYIHGLNVECAQWDRKRRCLVDVSLDARQLDDQMPAIKIEAVPHASLGLFEQPRDPRRRARSLKSSVSMGAQSLEEVVNPPVSL